MKYHISTTLNTSFDEAIAQVTDVLKEQGFGILSDIDVQGVFKKKLDVDFKKYRILGACNPNLAIKAITAEDKIGTMLPCNVLVQEHEEGVVEVSAIDPVASMTAVENDELQPIAAEVRDRLSAAIKQLG
jgi:uncharacterized protein (DUF302 family)